MWNFTGTVHTLVPTGRCIKLHSALWFVEIQTPEETPRPSGFTDTDRWTRCPSSSKLIPPQQRFASWTSKNATSACEHGRFSCESCRSSKLEGTGSIKQTGGWVDWSVLPFRLIGHRLLRDLQAATAAAGVGGQHEAPSWVVWSVRRRGVALQRVGDHGAELSEGRTLLRPLHTDTKHTTTHTFGHIWRRESKNGRRSPPRPHLVPTELHDVVDGGRGQFGPEQTVTLGYQGYNLMVLMLLERHTTLGENLPHQHTWIHRGQKNVLYTTPRPDR